MALELKSIHEELVDTTNDHLRQRERVVRGQDQAVGKHVPVAVKSGFAAVHLEHWHKTGFLR